jgi:steroid delta-isomerase-like uncharacterized protein
MSHSPKEVIRRFYKEFWNERKPEVVDELISPSHALTSPHISGPTVGPAAYKKQLAVFVGAFPDLRFTIEETICEHDKIAAYWTLTGTHKGVFLGIPPTNKPISITGITIHQVADGKILDSHAMWDAISLFQQFGVALPIKLETLAASTT